MTFHHNERSVNTVRNNWNVFKMAFAKSWKELSSQIFGKVSATGVIARAPYRFSSSITGISLSQDRRSVSLQFDGKESRLFHGVWLKHYCHCPKCRDVHSKQWQQPPQSIRGSYTLSDVKVEGGDVKVSWADTDEANHTGTFPIEWLKENAYGKDVLDKRAREACPKPLTGEPSEFEYDEIKDSKEVRLAWLVKLIQDGVCLVRNAPVVEGTVKKVGDLVYEVQRSRYGEVYDIKITENPDNLAYKGHDLPLHCDIPYYESPPGIQLLHCLKNDPCVQGGENVVVDLLHAAEQFCQDHPHDFEVLSKVPVTFYRFYEASSQSSLEPSAYMVYHRPLITVGHDKRVVSVYWSPHMEGVLCAPCELVEPFYEARWKWSNYMINFPIQHKLRLGPGDVLVFNNRRMIHKRTGLRLNGGDRHLQGAYINIDDFKSEVLAQCVLHGRPLPKERVGNNDYIK